MEQSIAKAYCEFVLQSKKAFDQIFNKEIDDNEELALLKETFNAERLYEAKCDFEKELMQNYVEYNDEELLHEYILINLEPIRNIEFKQTKAEILRNSWEVKFLLNLKYAIEDQRNFVYSLLVSETIYYPLGIDSVVEGIETYPHMSSHCKQLEAAENSIDKQDKLNSLANIPPSKDSRFEFELLLKECDSLKNNTERIKLITKRLFEFKQWKLLNEKVNEDFNFIVTNYSELYYPNFEKLCDIEIQKLEKLSKLENDLPINPRPDNNLSESTDKLNTPDYVWKSSATDLLELVTALYQNKSIERKDGKPLTRKELTAYFQQLFDVKIAAVENNLTRATNRKISQTPFLNNLAVQFVNYAEGKEAKNTEKMKRR